MLLTPQVWADGYLDEAEGMSRRKFEWEVKEEEKRKKSHGVG
jgi:hypothetical protein